jgi:RHH-type transcriptional regulator, rel operon repressor / antitoxin RelB
VFQKGFAYIDKIVLHSIILEYILIHCNMEKQTISFRLESDKVDALDVLAKALDRDRTYLLNEAVSAYLDVQQWQLEHLTASIKQADAGRLTDHADIKKMASHWRRRK